MLSIEGCRSRSAVIEPTRFGTRRASGALSHWAAIRPPRKFEPRFRLATRAPLRPFRTCANGCPERSPTQVASRQEGRALCAIVGEADAGRGGGALGKPYSHGRVRRTGGNHGQRCWPKASTFLRSFRHPLHLNLNLSRARALRGTGSLRPGEGISCARFHGHHGRRRSGRRTFPHRTIRHFGGTRCRSGTCLQGFADD